MPKSPAQTHPSLILTFCGEDESNNEPIETQDLSKNQNEDHAHEKPWLLSCAPHARVADNADRKTCCQPAEAHAQPSSELEETPAQRDTDSGQHKDVALTFEVDTSQRIFKINATNHSLSFDTSVVTR